MGAGFIPKVLDKDALDETLPVHSDDAIAMAKKLAVTDGILGGISTGANVVAALEVAKREENKGKMVVTIIPSFGERYLPSPLFVDL